jgi:hypothetical protein
VYKGLLKPESLLNETLKLQDSAGSHSVLYGLANWYFHNGQRDKAFELWQRITASDQWTSFGYIAAEADLKRFRNLRTK